MSTIIMPVILPSTPSAPAPLLHQFVFTTRDGRTATVSVTSPFGTEAEVVRRDLAASSLAEVAHKAPETDTGGTSFFEREGIPIFVLWIFAAVAGGMLRVLLDLAGLVDLSDGGGFWTWMLRIWLFSLPVILLGRWLVQRRARKVA